MEISEKYKICGCCRHILGITAWRLYLKQLRFALFCFCREKRDENEKLFKKTVRQDITRYSDFLSVKQSKFIYRYFLS